MPKLILHGSELSAPCRLVMLVAKLLSLDLELKVLDFLKGEHKSEAFTKMNPAQTFPTLDDNGFYIWESRATVTYLLEKYGGGNHKLYPKDVAVRATVDNMLFFDSSTLYARAGEYFYPRIYFAQPSDPVKEEAMRARMSGLERVLERQPYSAGQQLTISDVNLMCCTLALTDICEYDLSAFPRIKSYMQKCRKEIPHYEEVIRNGQQQQVTIFKSGKPII